jgi:hypothetical protein
VKSQRISDTAIVMDHVCVEEFMKTLLVVLALAATCAQAYELTGTECQAATESTGQITERRAQGYSLQDLTDNIDHWQTSYSRPEIANLLKAIAQWVYAEPDKSPIEMATRFWNVCSRSQGHIESLPLIPTQSALNAGGCLTVAEMSNAIEKDLKAGRELDHVLVEIWSAQDDNVEPVVTSGVADLAKQIYADRKQTPEAHAKQFLHACLDQAKKTARLDQ